MDSRYGLWAGWVPGGPTESCPDTEARHEMFFEWPTQAKNGLNSPQQRSCWGFRNGALIPFFREWRRIRYGPPALLHHYPYLGWQSWQRDQRVPRVSACAQRFVRRERTHRRIV